MKLTKYEHACFVLEKDGKLVVVNPGGYTKDLPALENVVGVVITHYHPDHFDPSALEALFASNPNMEVYGTRQVDQELTAAVFTHHSVDAGDEVSIGPFNLEFFGGNHAEIHSSRPIDQNVGVLINSTVYYPGDSFALPNVPIKVLALPTAAPWLKIGETIDYLVAVKPGFAFPTHDAVASDIGKNLVDRMLPDFARSYGGTYQRLVEPLEIDG